jgi:hypothetical protein
MDDDLEEIDPGSLDDDDPDELEEPPDDEESTGEEEPEAPSAETIAIAEEPSIWLPDEPTRTVFHGDGFAFVSSGRQAWVQQVRLGRNDLDAVRRVINHVDAILSLRKIPEAQWWLGELTTPRNLAKRLLELGLEKDRPSRMTSMTIARQPGGEAAVEVREALTKEDWQQALEIDWEAFRVPEEERTVRRSELVAAWPRLVADGTTRVYTAFIDGEPVGFGRAVFTPYGTLMLGGATLKEARGKGVYTSLVHARWEDAATQPVARLVVAAGPRSAPILEKLGFETMGRVRLLRQRAT